MRKNHLEIEAKEAYQLDLFFLELLFDSSFSLCDYVLQLRCCDLVSIFDFVESIYEVIKTSMLVRYFRCNRKTSCVMNLLLTDISSRYSLMRMTKIESLAYMNGC